MKRTIYIERIKKDLEKKMVFLVGPRQVGKTWVAKTIMKDFPEAVYLNYDNAAHRKIMKDESWLDTVPLLVFDEIHKMRGWKNYLKGVFDTKAEGIRILVTGSARLDAHKKIGDSMAGRYFTHHLMPLSLTELQGTVYEVDAHERLIARGGFPEPFLAQDIDDIEKWRSAYKDTLLREDVLDLGSVENMTAMRQLFDVLRNKVGSPISVSGLAGDLGIAPATVRRYIGLFEALYLIFTIRPYSHKIARSILKEPKIYFYDTGLVEGVQGAKFENFVAVSLLTKIYDTFDRTGRLGVLAFLKTKEGKEVDFALIDDKNKLQSIYEAKLSDTTLSPTLRYFSEKYQVPGVQIVEHIRVERKEGELITVRNTHALIPSLLTFST